MDLENKIEQLFLKIDALDTRIIVLTDENEELKNKVVALTKENEGLNKKVNLLESGLVKKNSKNSSIPPSKDENRVKPNQSLRTKSGKKTGGQKGHKGSFLKMADKVDHVIDHKVDYCKCCQESLIDSQELLSKRQVIDIPRIEPIITEHRIYIGICKCGKMNKGKYPKSVRAPISYGSTITATIGYMSVGQYMSMERITEYFEQRYNIQLSEGTICNKLAHLTEQCMPMYEQIKQRIEQSKVIGSDETGCVVNGSKWWLWTWQNTKLTYITASDTRGYRAITDSFPNGLTNSILVSDCWASQLKTPALKHQLCMSHIQRELKYFIESCTNRWSRCFLNLIYKSLKLKKEILQDTITNYKKAIEIIKIKSLKLLDQKIKGPKKLLALKKRLKKHIGSLWVFLDHNEVPPDNNGSERAIRNAKVKQKVSGQFRSENGAHQFAILRSVYDTTRKNKGKTFQVFELVANYVPE